MLKNLARILLFFPVLVSNHAATLTVPCNFLSISNALVAAKEGDVVQIGPGQCVWESPMILDRGISFTIRGSGTNQTTLISGASGAYSTRLWIRSNSRNVFTISDMTCIGSPYDNGFFINGGNPPCPPMNGPIHIYNIRMPNVAGRAINMGAGDSFGLIDHCYFEVPLNAQFTVISFFGNEYVSWANPIPLGTTNAVCVEDCYFKTQPKTGGNGFFDGYNGAQAVLRHNIFDGTANNGAHGYDSQVTSVRTGEIYNNVFTNITAGGASLMDWRGGTLLWFNNVTYAPTAQPNAIVPLLKYYRGCDGIVNTIANFVNVPQVVSFSANLQDGASLTLINQPPYVFKTQITSASQYRQVVIGPTLAQSIANLVSCISLDPAGAGVRYSAATLSNPIGRNLDVRVTTFDDTSLTLINILDGPNAFGWPAAFQLGVIGVTKYANTGITRYPCYSWNNTINGVKTGFALAFLNETCNGHNNITNLLQSGRDYFQDVDSNWSGPPPGYTPLIYPHPLNTVSNGSNTAGGLASPPSAPTGLRILQ